MKHQSKPTKSTRKETQVGVRFSKPQLEMVARRAAARGVTITEHVRDLAIRDAEANAQSAGAAA